MNEESLRSIRAVAAMQGVALSEAEAATLLPMIERNLDTVMRLAPRIAFEDEPALYADAIGRAKG